ncbi:hypothetical protein sS8_2434 [Methylocaldum marinum]|uniref:Uncharacterized protein n=1 Tax=Methylocaldum marinum TaxID=1432792 RepID=A0A250KS60_9GAMM|nr:hypothetical protein [Methylocaldum marinum]BBA34386.1 hypothetical protein sS8_2434 [Methylocaldum marinum]
MRLAPFFLGTALAMTGQAQAASYYLDQTNLEQAPFTDGPRYLAVTSVASGNDIQFTVDVRNGPGQPFESIEGSNFGIQQFGFNLANDNGASLEADSFTGLPAGWNVDFNRTLNGFGRFDVVLSGTGSARQAPLTFNISDIVGDTPASYHAPSGGAGAVQGNAWYAAHVAGFTGPEQITSGFFGGGSGPGTAPAPVPIPGAVWLFGSAVVGLGLVARRSRRV